MATQGVASLALGYALVGLSARFCALMPFLGRTNDNTIIPRVSLRLPWAMRLLGFQPASMRLCPFGDAYPRI